jgi:hypothetical protein
MHSHSAKSTNSTLHVAAPSIHIKGDSAFLTADVTIGETTTPLWFKVPSEYASYLTTERCDAFCVGLLFEALHRGLNITSEAPMSDQLFYQLESTLLDFLARIYKDRNYRRISIQTPIEADVLPTANANGTGVSCGIDSLAAIIGQDREKFGPMGLTHLCFFDTGSHGQDGKPEESERFEKRRQHARSYCEAAGLPFLEVVTNLSEFYTVPFGVSHTYRDAAPVLSLQKLFANYFYASGATVFNFLMDKDDPAYLDAFLLPMLSTRNTRLYSSESTLTRLEKTRIVASDSLAGRFLNVCNYTAENCGRCNKCLRTLLTLEALGCIDRFHEVFNLDYYRKNYRIHLTYHCAQVYGGDVFHREIDPLLRPKIPVGARVAGLRQHLMAVTRSKAKHALRALGLR